MNLLTNFISSKKNQIFRNSRFKQSNKNEIKQQLEKAEDKAEDEAEDEDDDLIKSYNNKKEEKEEEVSKTEHKTSNGRRTKVGPSIESRKPSVIISVKDKGAKTNMENYSIIPIAPPEHSGKHKNISNHGREEKVRSPNARRIISECKSPFTYDLFVPDANMRDETSESYEREKSQNSFNTDELDDLSHHLKRSTNSYKFLCTNVSNNLNKHIKNDDEKEWGQNISKSKQYHSCPESLNSWKPPDSHGLKNSKKIVPEYYYNNYYFNKTPPFLDIDYSFIVKDDIRNMRPLNEYQIEYIHQLEHEKKDEFIDELIKMNEHFINIFQFLHCNEDEDAKEA